MKEFFKTLGKGLLALALVGGLATGGYYIGTAIVPAQKIEQPDKPDVDNPDVDLPSIDEDLQVEIDITPLGLANNSVFTKKVNDGVLISSDKEDCGLWFYNFENENLSKICLFNSDFSIFQEYNNGYLVNGLNNAGILFFDNETHEINQVYLDGSWNCAKQIKSGYLISASYREKDSGLLYLNSETNNFSKLYSNGCSWGNVFELENGYLISSNDSNGSGLLYFNNETYEVRQVYTEGYGWNDIEKYEDGYFVGSAYSSYGLLYFNNSDLSVKLMASDGYWGNKDNDVPFCRVKDGYIFDASTFSCRTVFFNVNDFTFTILPMRWGYDLYQNVDCGVLMTKDANDCGLWFFDNETHQVTEVYKGPHGFDNNQSINNGFIFWSSNSSYRDVIYYDNESRQAKKLELDGSFRLNAVLPVEGGCFLLGEHNNRGFYYFDIATQTVKNLIYPFCFDDFAFCSVEGGYLFGSSFDSGLVFFDNLTQEASIIRYGVHSDYFQPTDDGCLIGSSQDSGLLYFNNATHEVTDIYTDGSKWQYFQQVENGYLITSANTNGILFFDNSTHEITEIYSDGSNWQYFQSVDGGYLISSTLYNSGLLFFDNSTHEVTKVYTDGRAWGNFQPTDDGCLIGSDSVAGLLYFNNSTREVVQIYNETYCYFKDFVQVEDGFIVYNHGNRLKVLHYFNSTHSVELLVSDSSTNSFSSEVSENEIIFKLQNNVFIVDLDTCEVRHEIILS